MSCRPGRNGKSGAPAGFTLLEVLLAVAILGMAYLAIMQNFSVSMKNIERLDRNGRRLFAAQTEMEMNFLARNISEEIDGEIFVEGGKFKVVVMTGSETGKLVTLGLKKL
jgi:prepilin-type N-terminal cleavage/methylation domain-containing protein